MNLKKIIVFFTSLLGALFFFCDDVLAWGTGIHIAQGEFVLNNLKLVLPAIRELLQTYPLDFLYGCISADIFIGKGSRRRDDHCHNWSIGHKMITVARAPFEKAFTYGYLSHLVADTVAHNFYIPNQLYLTSTTRKFGHLYWEYRSDIFTEKKYWKMAKNVIVSHDRRNDAFITQTVPNRLLSFKTKKRIYLSTLHIYDLDHWSQAVNLVSQNSRWEANRQYIEFLKKLSFYLTIDFLKNPETAICLNYDPVGSGSIREAKRRRRLIRKLNGKKPTEMGFEIPSEMIEIANKMEQLNLSF
ncbi:MAG: zinc dependent phospholipase C family protein [Deltaproteobacteria bacterium]|nr:zinc dependent phospholipase C family protein [Deltaproteobacteria bacterium]